VSKNTAYTVQHGCQIAVTEIGHDFLGAVRENRARIAGENSHATCLGGEERWDDFRTDSAGGSGNQNHEL
jgi:hypothetical protein